MEFEDVSEKIEWEARRVAVAFGVEEWGEQGIPCHREGNYYLAGVGCRGTMILWTIDCSTQRWMGVTVYGPNRTESAVSLDLSTGWSCRFRSSTTSALMAHGLYRLGFDDEDVLTELNHHFTAHEQLELRLSMPREFWPKKWLDEEDQTAPPPNLSPC